MPEDKPVKNQPDGGAERPITSPTLDLEKPADSQPAGSVPPDSPDGSGEGRKTLFGTVLEFAGELIHVVVISLAIIIPIRYFLIQPFYVNGASMEPSFYDHEYLIIDEISYRFGDPTRGDIIVFRYPNDPSQFFIKRIIGLPGERVVIGGGVVRIYAPGDAQGQVLNESSYLGMAATAGTKDITLGEDEYFLMGDNRAASLDSRVFGPVPREFIVGRVWFRGWPPEKIHFFTSSADLK